MEKAVPLRNQQDIKEIEDIGVVETIPKMQGKDLSMLIVPK